MAMTISQYRNRLDADAAVVMAPWSLKGGMGGCWSCRLADWLETPPGDQRDPGLVLGYLADGCRALRFRGYWRIQVMEEFSFWQ